jgi:7-alpha-hydroxysteroid dehydrogenase
MPTNLRKLERVSETSPALSRPLLRFARRGKEANVILDKFRLDGQVAVVTGAGRGLGAAIALAFAEVGADVVIAARTQSQLEEVAEQVRAVGRKAHIVVADLAHPDDTAELAAEAVEAFGKLDIVVNNVGGTMPNTLLTTSVKDMKDAFTFNVLTAHALTIAAVPLMLEHSGGGSIINITSTMGRLAGRGFAAYATAKGALAHYTRQTALDLCPRVRVNAIAPGSILTSALEIVASNDELRAPMEKATPMRRLGDPADIAAAAVYLASPAGSFLTGKTLEVDGGLTVPNLDLPIPDL